MSSSIPADQSTSRGLTLGPPLPPRCRMRWSQIFPVLQTTRQRSQDAAGYPSAQCIPHELLVIIFSSFSLEVGFAAFAYGGFLPHFAFDHMSIPTLRMAITNLFSLTRVCKSWYMAGTEALYARVYLTSQYRVWCFNRTLKRNPSLTSLVRQIFILHSDTTPKLSLSRDTLLPRKDTCRVRSKLAASMLACQSLETLTFTVYHGKHTRRFSSWDNEFIRGFSSQIPPSLKRLVIIGRLANANPNPLTLIPSSGSFPLLKHLKLRYLQLEPNHEFPALPSLLTLEIFVLTHPYDSESPPPMHIQSTKFPSLTALILYESRTQIHIDKECLHKLEKLVLLGVEEHKYFQSEVHTSNLDQVEEMAFQLDYFQVTGEPFIVSRLPRGLKALYLYTNFTGSKASHPVIASADPLNDLVERFDLVFEGCTTLNKMVFYLGGFKGQDTSEVDSGVENLRRSCESRGIRFELRRYLEEDYVRLVEDYVVDWPSD